MIVRRWLALAVILGTLGGVGAAWSQVSPESAEKYKEGQELYGKRRYQDALKAFEEAVSLDGKNAQALRAMGRTYEDLRDHPKATESYQMALAVKPDYVAVQYELGKLQFKLRKYGEAQVSFAQVLKLDASFQEGKAREFLKVSYLKQGGQYFKRRDYKKAAEQYRKATNVDPTDATTFYNMGLAYWKGRSFSEAIGALSTAVDLDPTHKKAYKALGDLYRATRKNSDAIRAYRKAIGVDAKMQNAYINLAATYIATEQPAKAVSTLNKALAQGLKNTKVYGALGHAYAQQKAWDSAISSYKKALASKDNPEVRYRLAVAYLATEKYEAAITQATSGARSKKYKVPANVILGDTYEASKPEGWKEKAIKHYEVGLADRQYSKYCEDKIERIKNPMGLTEEELNQQDQ